MEGGTLRLTHGPGAQPQRGVCAAAGRQPLGPAAAECLVGRQPRRCQAPRLSAGAALFGPHGLDHVHGCSARLESGWVRAARHHWRHRLSPGGVGRGGRRAGPRAADVSLDGRSHLLRLRGRPKASGQRTPSRYCGDWFGRRAGSRVGLCERSVLGCACRPLGRDLGAATPRRAPRDRRHLLPRRHRAGLVVSGRRRPAHPAPC
mmetsp:Transcript_39479/g.70766  ORF Transcript_39479/g.70766 Transcript_39479/m.70766 type:complete len:204 (+) Transcript_39479:950-1561(+)